MNTSHPMKRHEQRPASPDGEISCDAYALSPVAQALVRFGFRVEHNGAGPVMLRDERDGGLTTVCGAERDGCGAHFLTEGIRIYRTTGAGDETGPETFENLAAYTDKLKGEILSWLAAHRAEHVDAKTDELNLTTLVEAWDEACSAGEATVDEHHIAWELAPTLVRL